MNEVRVTTKKMLLEHIDRDWLAINRLLDRLSKTQWTTIRNADGWAVKDHVAHLSAWEQSVIAFLSGKPRHAGLQVAEALYLSADLDAINDAIFRAHQQDALDAVRARFQATHAELYGLIEPLSDEDLNRPYAHFLPGESSEGAGPPAINIIYGNTAHHFRLHQEWIEDMLTP